MSDEGNEERGAVDAPKPMSEDESAAIGESAAAEFGLGESEDDEPVEDIEVPYPEPHGAYEEPAEAEDEPYDDQSWDQSEPETEQVDEAAYEPEGELSEADRALLAERRARLKAERSLEWLRSEELARRRRHWQVKEAKHVPYLGKQDLQEIAEGTSSRREFVRRAKQLNEKVGAIAQPLIEERLAKERAALREEAKRAWGPPSSGPGVPSEATKISGDIEKAREAGDLEGAIRGHMESIFGKLD